MVRRAICVMYLLSDTPVEICLGHLHQHAAGAINDHSSTVPRDRRRTSRGMLDRLDRPNMPARDILLDCELIIGQSCGAAASSNPEQKSPNPMLCSHLLVPWIFGKPK
jgi:hypothetical protein